MKLSLLQDTERKVASNDTGGQRNSEVAERARNRDTTLGAVLHDVDADLPPSAAGIAIKQVGCDSRKVQTGSLFFALHGANVDGNAFVRDAVSRGVAVIASEENPPDSLPDGVPWIRVREARKALAVTAANFFGHPAAGL